MGKRSPLVCQSWISAEPFWKLLDPRLDERRQSAAGLRRHRPRRRLTR